MDLEPTLQDATTSTSTESTSKNTSSHDVAAFGVSSDLSCLKLPTKQDILRYYFFLAERAQIQSKMLKTFTPHVRDKLIDIWSSLNIEIIDESIGRKLNVLLDKYREEDENKTKGSTFKAFVQSTKELFYIGKCECDLKADLCSCGLIPEHLKHFMLDQHNDRKSTIPEYVPEIEEQIPTSTIIPTCEDRRDTSIPEEDMDIDDEHILHPVRRESYTSRYNALNFAKICDRYGVSDRIASALATSLMEDIGIKDDRGNLIIMNKSEVHREKDKSRQEMVRKRFDASNLTAFSFDDRKNDSSTLEKIDKKFHQTMVKEPHLVVLKEPNSQLLGYTKVENEDSEHKLIKLNEFFIDKEISLDSLIGICCDGEPTNTGIRNGILRRYEMQLNRPLHWFVCLLHFNELPFRHLFDTLEKSTTTGRRTTIGTTLSKQIENCENLPAVNGFETIALENMADLNDVELGSDAKYLYRMALAIAAGQVPVNLSDIKPGPIVNSRRLTTASRLLRLYVTTNKPPKNLEILANYVMKVYVPMYFNIQYYNSVVYGSVLFSKFIRWTQYLESNLRDIVYNVIKENSYYAHSENVLLAMLFDKDKKIRDLALKKILHYRNNLDEPMRLRVYRKPIINFNCTDYTNLIDLNDDDILFEPPFTRNIPYDILKQYLKYNYPPLQDPKIPLHIQGTERHVQLLASGSKRVIDEEREGVMKATLESRKKLPRRESKKHSQK